MKFSISQHKALASAVSVSFILVLAGTGNGHAAKGNAFASVDIANICTLNADDPNNAMLLVDTMIVDTGDPIEGVAPVFGNKTVQAQQKPRRGRWVNLGDAVVTTPDDNPVMVNLCAAGLDPEARAVNASVTVEVLNSKKVFFSSRCDDDPATDDVDESELDIEGLGLCPVAE